MMDDNDQNSNDTESSKIHNITTNITIDGLLLLNLMIS